MSDKENSKIVVCSVMVKPIRVIFIETIRTWIDQIVRVPVHTFAVDESKIPLNVENPDGYWYCAGDFCDIDEAGVYQHIEDVDIKYAKCLVAPNITDDDPQRPGKVIAGRYAVNYVCHNITNRVLYSTDSKITLGDIDILKTGYSLVVKSVLGVYGQNKVEWERKKLFCGPDSRDLILYSEKAANNRAYAERQAEIEKIHLAACDGNLEKAQTLSLALKDVDDEFYQMTSKAVNLYDRNQLYFENYNIKMMAACSQLFSKTISKVGRNVAMKIYPDCNININVIDNSEKKKERLVACA